MKCDDLNAAWATDAVMIEKKRRREREKAERLPSLHPLNDIKAACWG